MGKFTSMISVYIGEKVKLDRRGNPYKIGDNGRRLFRTSLRPKGTYSLEEWRKLSQSDRNTSLRPRRRSWRRKAADDMVTRKIDDAKKKKATKGLKRRRRKTAKSLIPKMTKKVSRTGKTVHTQS